MRWWFWFLAGLNCWLATNAAIPWMRSFDLLCAIFFAIQAYDTGRAKP